MKLECQSSGGKPAPRIEWLNISSPVNIQSFSGADNGADLSLQQPAHVQLMRTFWPQKKATFSDQHQHHHQLSQVHQHQHQPITSSSVTISLSRFDLQSHFMCLVLPATSTPTAPHQQQPFSIDPLLSPSSNGHFGNQDQHLAAYLSSLLVNQARANGATSPMLKWIKLDVQGECIRNKELPVMTSGTPALKEPAFQNKMNYNCNSRWR